MNAFVPFFGLIVLLAISSIRQPEWLGGISLQQTQALKAITSLYIVLGHIGKVVEQPLWFTVVNSFGWIDVGVFFFISGFGLSFGFYNKPNYFQSYVKRINSVLIPY